MSLYLLCEQRWEKIDYEPTSLRGTRYSFCKFFFVEKVDNTRYFIIYIKNSLCLQLFPIEIIHKIHASCMYVLLKLH